MSYLQVQSSIFKNPFCPPAQSQITRSLALSFCDFFFLFNLLSPLAGVSIKGAHVGAPCPKGVWRQRSPVFCSPSLVWSPLCFPVPSRSPASLAPAYLQSLLTPVTGGWKPSHFSEGLCPVGVTRLCWCQGRGEVPRRQKEKHSRRGTAAPVAIHWGPEVAGPRFVLVITNLGELTFTIKIIIILFPFWERK